MGQRIIVFSDLSGKEGEDGKMGRVTVQYSDGRRGTYELDVTDEEAEELVKKGRKINTRD
jgi:hypothetical protein